MKKRILTIFVAFLAVFTALSYLNFIKKPNTPVNSGSQVATGVATDLSLTHTQQYFTDQLKKEETALYQEIEQEFGVQPEQLRADYSQQWRKTPGKPASDEPMQKLVYEVSEAYNFNADKLNIVLKNSEAASPASCNSSGQLTIEKKIFSTIPEPAQRFIIAHELHHILCNDFNQIRAINRKVPENAMTSGQKQLFEKFSKFQEKRADFYAALHGAPWANGYVAFAQEGLKRCKSGSGNYHPTWEDRAQWASDIVNQMQRISIA